MTKELTKEMSSLLEELIDPNILLVLNQILEKFELYLDLRKFGYKRYSIPRNLVNDDSEYDALEESRRQAEINSLVSLKSELANINENKIIPFRNESFDRRLHSTLEISKDKTYVILIIFDSITNQELAVIKITKGLLVFMRYLGDLVNNPDFVYEVKETILEDGLLKDLNMDTYLLSDKVYGDSIEHNLGHSNLGESVDNIDLVKLSSPQNVILGLNPNKTAEIYKLEKYSR